QPEHKSYTFPESDLFRLLIDAYFDNSNIILPVLHRPTLEDGIRSGKHITDESFGGVILLVCAIGARFLADSRVLLPGSNLRYSAGWTWFTQIDIPRLLMFSASRLHDLQIACLGAIYLAGCSMPAVGWNMVAIGIRIAQNIGVHKKHVYGSKPTVQDELFKRSFWVLLFLDRWESSTTGHPCTIQEEDFDLDMPVDCDDEYWLLPNPDLAFSQPTGQPSRVSAFICNLRLCQILGYALRTIYASKKAKRHFGFAGEEWERRTIANFDSILNMWADSVPDHLRWDPTRDQDVFYLQSGHLYAHFYDLQVLVHRPFISPRKTPSHSFPSIAICVNAARSCTHLIDALHKRWPKRFLPYLHVSIYRYLSSTMGAADICSSTETTFGCWRGISSRHLEC
ncbi:fungal-specific transcription factor domain-containing protein, partial [Vararia minispora EC-137]